MLPATKDTTKATLGVINPEKRMNFPLREPLEVRASSVNGFREVASNGQNIFHELAAADRASLNEQDVSGETALHVAHRCENTQGEQVLVTHGADTSIRDI